MTPLDLREASINWEIRAERHERRAYLPGMTAEVIAECKRRAAVCRELAVHASALVRGKGRAK